METPLCSKTAEELREVIDDCSRALEEGVSDYPKVLCRRSEAHEALEDFPRALADAVRYCKIEPSAEATRRCQILRDRVGKKQEKDTNTLLPQNILKALHESDDPLNYLSVLEQSRNRYSKDVIVKAGAIEKVTETLLLHDGNDEVATMALTFLWKICTTEQMDAPVAFDVPYPVDTATALARDRLRESLDPRDLETFLRHPQLCNNAARVLCYLGDLQSDICLEALVTSIDAVEAGESTGVQVLGQWCDNRRRLGKSVKAFVPRQSFHKAFEACLRQTETPSYLQGTCAQAWTLITDSDRGDDEKIDVAEVVRQYLNPFWSSADGGYRANGLMALAVLFHVDAKVPTQVVQAESSAFQCIINACIAGGNVDHNEQHWGADVLMHAMRDPSLRKSVLEAGGIDILVNLLNEVSQWDNAVSERASRAQMLKAKVVAVLGMLAAHSENTRKDVFSAVDFMAGLSVAIGLIRGMDEGDDRRRHAKALLEGIVMLSVHGSFKEMLVLNFKAMDVFKSGLVRPSDLRADGQLAFLYACVLQNLLRSRENKVRPKKKEYPYNEMTDQDVDAMEEFYEKMPVESRPVKNGVVDMGPPELAEQYREAFCLKECIECLNVIAQHGSTIGRRMTAECFKYFCEHAQRRRQVVAHGGVRALLRICDIKDEDGNTIDAARQSLAQICITTNPQIFAYSDAMDMIPPLISLLGHAHELLQYEAAMGITNLASVPNLRERVVAANGWAALKNLLFSENFRLQRAGLEGMCNLCLDDDVIEKFISGKYDVELKVFLSFASAQSDDDDTLVAVTGALAILAQIPEIATKILSVDNIKGLLGLFSEPLIPAVEHRMVSLLASLSQVKSPLNEKGIVRAALHMKGQHGCASKEAQAIIDELK